MARERHEHGMLCVNRPLFRQSKKNSMFWKELYQAFIEGNKLFISSRMKCWFISDIIRNFAFNRHHESNRTTEIKGISASRIQKPSIYILVWQKVIKFHSRKSIGNTESFKTKTKTKTYMWQRQQNMKTTYEFLKGKYWGKYLVLLILIIYGEYETTWRLIN